MEKKFLCFVHLPLFLSLTYEDVARRNRFLKQLLMRFCIVDAARHSTITTMPTTVRAMLELVAEGVLVESIDDVKLGIRVEELGLSVIGGNCDGRRLKVCESVVATKALRDNVLGSGDFVFLIESVEPHTLVLLINLCSPATVWSRHNAFVFQRREFPGFGLAENVTTMGGR